MIIWLLCQYSKYTYWKIALSINISKHCTIVSLFS